MALTIITFRIKNPSRVYCIKQSLTNNTVIGLQQSCFVLSCISMKVSLARFLDLVDAWFKFSIFSRSKKAFCQYYWDRCCSQFWMIMIVMSGLLSRLGQLGPDQGPG